MGLTENFRQEKKILEETLLFAKARIFYLYFHWKVGFLCRILYVLEASTHLIKFSKLLYKMGQDLWQTVLQEFVKMLQWGGEREAGSGRRGVGGREREAAQSIFTIQIRFKYPDPQPLEGVVGRETLLQDWRKSGQILCRFNVNYANFLNFEFCEFSRGLYTGPTGEQS